MAQSNIRYVQTVDAYQWIGESCSDSKLWPMWLYSLYAQDKLFCGSKGATLTIDGEILSVPNGSWIIAEVTGFRVMNNLDFEKQFTLIQIKKTPSMCFRPKG